MSLDRSMLWRWLGAAAAGALVAGQVAGEPPARPQPIAQPAQQARADGLFVQPPDTLPKSNAPLAQPQRKPKRPHQIVAPLATERRLTLNAGWELIEAPRLKQDATQLSQSGVDTAAWYDAVVPGTVLTTLVDQGVYPDPYYGLNNMAIPEGLNKQDYWYRVEFRVPPEFKGRQLSLQFDGINYYAEVWLNGKPLGNICGAFIRGMFDVTKHVRTDGPNVLAVMVAPPPDPGVPHEQSLTAGPGMNGGRMCLDGPTFFCTEGWDWIPAIRDRCTGIWQDVSLLATGPVAIGDPRVVTTLPLPDVSRADVRIEAELRNAGDRPQKGTLRGKFDSVTFEQAVTLQAGETRRITFEPKSFPQLTVRQPRLWWPNGYGKPELYQLELSFTTAEGQESDRKRLRFGIREITYELSVKTPGGPVRRIEYSPTAALGNAEPAIDIRREALYKLEEPPAKAKIKPKAKKTDGPTVVSLAPGGQESPTVRFIEESLAAPYLIVKVNGRRILCKGGNWGMDDALKRCCREKLEPYVRLHRDAHFTMLRNWCGQSTEEALYDLCDEYGILVWNDFWMSTEGHNFGPEDHALILSNIADTLKRYRNHPSIAIWCGRNEGVPPEPVSVGLDRLVRELDGTRYYQPTSRWLNLRPSGPWSYQPLEKYFTTLADGFSTEIGLFSIPSAEVMRSMMPKQDVWPISDAWAYHDYHSVGNGGAKPFTEAMARRYGEPSGLDDFCRKAQMINYENHRAIYEAWNSKLGASAGGVLLWMSHPSWPSVVWQLYTWNYDPNGSFFGAQKACEPVHVQMNLPDLAVAVVNNGFEPLDGVVAEAEVYGLDGRRVSHQRASLRAAANACTKSFRVNWPDKPGAYLVKLALRDRQGKLLSDNFYWHARDENELRQLGELPPVALDAKVTVRAEGGRLVASGKLLNHSPSPALMVRLTLRDLKTGGLVLPAYYDANYVSLLPGEGREFRIETEKLHSPPTEAGVDLDGWNIKHATVR